MFLRAPQSKFERWKSKMLCIKMKWSLWWALPSFVEPLSVVYFSPFPTTLREHSPNVSLTAQEVSLEFIQPPRVLKSPCLRRVFYSGGMLLEAWNFFGAQREMLSQGVFPKACNVPFILVEHHLVGCNWCPFKPDGFALQVVYSLACSRVKIKTLRDFSTQRARLQRNDPIFTIICIGQFPQIFH